MTDIPNDLTPSDRELLLHIDREGVAVPVVAGEDIGITNIHAGRRLTELTKRGFVRRYHTGVYLLTDRGRELVEALREQDDDGS